ncbi:MAG: hypothetical protein AAFV86_02870 [Pseudomonadota bacterium]
MRRLALLAGLAAAPLVLLPALATLAALPAHDGFCYGFTDGRWPCDLAVFARREASLAFLLTLFWNAIYALALVAVAWIAARRRAALTA